jgi:TetR/AcrR family transcriptional regulator, mexJK operon transcriptional repressor
VSDDESVSRRERIVRVAAELFLERAFDSVTMDDVIGAAGGSKATLYGYFGSKEGLLHAVVEQVCRDVSVSIDVSRDGTLSEQAYRVGHSFASSVVAEPIQRFYRLVASVGRTFPEVGRLFYAAGPETACGIIAGWLAEHQREGTIRADLDPYRIAVIFHDMLIGDGLTAWLAAVDDPSTIRERVDATVTLAVEILLGGIVAPSP